MIWMVLNALAPGSGLHVVGYSNLAWFFGASVWMLWGVLTYSRLIVHPVGFIGFLLAAALVVLVTSVVVWRKIRSNQFKNIPTQAIANVVLSIIIAAHISFNFKHVHGVELFFVPTDSMTPTIHAGEVVLADTTEEAIKNVSSGDIVAFQYNKRSGEDIWIKRITDLTDYSVSMAGDNVSTSVSARYLQNIPKENIQGVVQTALGIYSPNDFSLGVRQLK